MGAQFDAYTAARQKMFARLDDYESLNDDDNIVHLLKSVFRSPPPPQGQSHLADDVDLCHNDDQLRQLVEHLEITLLKPMLAAGGTTPAITPSPLPIITTGNMKKSKVIEKSSARGILSTAFTYI